MNLKNFLKGNERVDKVAHYVAEHYRENVEPLGYKAFLVGVDREACAYYKEALDKYPAAGIFGDRLHRQQQRLGAAQEVAPRREAGEADPQELRQARRVAEDPHRHREAADRLRRADPVRDVSRQADARPHAPAGHRAGEPAYENEAQEMVKPHGFVLDFVGIFDKLEKALAFDSDEINAIVKDLGLLKAALQVKMETKAPSISRSSTTTSTTRTWTT